MSYEVVSFNEVAAEGRIIQCAEGAPLIAHGS